MAPAAQAAGAPADPEAVRAALERVLAGSEFQEKKSALEQGLERLWDRLSPHGDGLPGVLGQLLELLPVLLVVLGAWWVWHALRDRRPASASLASQAAQPALGARAAAALAAARAARAAGDAREALRQYGLALVLALGAEHALEFRAAWTERELLRRGRPEPDARALVEGLLGELEAKRFGRAPVAEADLERLDLLCAGHVEAAR